MTTVEPLIPGLYARSETLVEATRDHDRGRIDDAALADAFRCDLERVVGAQVAAGFTRVSTGQLAWNDLFRPFSAIVEGLTAPSLVRFLDTNTFYRRPDLADGFRLRANDVTGFVDRVLPTLGSTVTVATLPSPTAFVAGAAGEDGTFPRTDLATQVAERVLAPVVEAIGRRGPATIVLSDPWLSRHPEAATLLESLEPLVHTRAPGVTVLLQLPYADAAPLVSHLSHVPVDGVIFDLALTELSALKGLSSRLSVGLGVVDARSSLVETPERIAAVAARAAERLATNTLFLAPTGDLQHVPETIARRKLYALGEATRIAARVLGGGS